MSPDETRSPASTPMDSISPDRRGDRPQAPGRLAIAVYSPPLDRYGNSVRGLAFCEALIERYNFHHYDSLTHEPTKQNPRRPSYARSMNRVSQLIWAASRGDLNEIFRLQAEGVALDAPDYDGRTALHLAAAEQQTELLGYLLSQGLKPDVPDRWGHTPLDEARRNAHKAGVSLLEQAQQQIAQQEA